MKKHLTLLSILCWSALLWAQAPAAFNFQSVLHSPEGTLLADQNVNLQLDILQGSATDTVVYSESHAVLTNSLGLVNLAIGTGMTTDDFSTIDWGNGPYFLQITVDGNPAGATQLLSVPYALYASNAGSTPEADPVFAASPAQQITEAGSGAVITTDERDQLARAISVDTPWVAGDMLTYDGNNWVTTTLTQTGFTGFSDPFNNMQPYTVVNFIIALQGIFPSRSSSEPFIAEITMFGGNFAPRGWAFCDGQLLPINQNQALFSILGTTYGGDGRTTFALPDLRGRVPVHAGDGPGIVPKRLGRKGGNESTTLSPFNLPSHNHSIIKN